MASKDTAIAAIMEQLIGRRSTSHGAGRDRAHEPRLARSATKGRDGNIRPSGSSAPESRIKRSSPRIWRYAMQSWQDCNLKERVGL